MVHRNSDPLVIILKGSLFTPPPSLSLFLSRSLPLISPFPSLFSSYSLSLSLSLSLISFSLLILLSLILLFPKWNHHSGFLSSPPPLLPSSPFNPLASLSPIEERHCVSLTCLFDRLIPSQSPCLSAWLAMCCMDKRIGGWLCELPVPSPALHLIDLPLHFFSKVRGESIKCWLLCSVCA